MSSGSPKFYLRPICLEPISPDLYPARKRRLSFCVKTPLVKIYPRYRGSLKVESRESNCKYLLAPL